MIASGNRPVRSFPVVNRRKHSKAAREIRVIHGPLHVRPYRHAAPRLFSRPDPHDAASSWSTCTGSETTLRACPSATYPRLATLWRNPQIEVRSVVAFPVLERHPVPLKNSLGIGKTNEPNRVNDRDIVAVMTVMGIVIANHAPIIARMQGMVLTPQRVAR